MRQADSGRREPLWPASASYGLALVGPRKGGSCVPLLRLDAPAVAERGHAQLNRNLRVVGSNPKSRQRLTVRAHCAGDREKERLVAAS